MGHTKCGGVQACYDVVNGGSSPHLPPPDSVLWKWLGPLRAVASANKGKPVEWLTTENVQIQMRNVKAALLSLNISDVAVTGYVYDVETRTISQVTPPTV